MRISDWSSECALPILAPSLDRTADPHRLAIFGHRAPRDVETLGLEQIDQRVVRQDFLGVFGGDPRAERALDRLGGHRLTAGGGLDRAGAELFELEPPAPASQIVFPGAEAYGRCV